MATDPALPPAHWFAEMAHGSRLIFFVMRTAPEVVYEYLSDAVEDLVGVSAAEGMADAAAIHGRVDPAYGHELLAALATPPGEQITVELKWLHRDTGQALYTRCWARASERADGSVVLEGTVAEITELRDAEVELRHSEERHRLLAENAYDVIWTMGLDGSITYVSPAVQRMRGITPQEAMRQTIDEIHPPQTAESVSAYYQRLFGAIAEGDTPPPFRGEHEYYRQDGSIMTGEVQVIPHLDADGRVVEILGVTRDISDRKRFEDELMRLAVTDALTGLWNRRHGRELLDADLDTAQRQREGLCLLMVDIDKFKAINDTYGHQSGDRVLIEIARRLRDSVRVTDVVARWGGDEFLVLLRHCEVDAARSVAEKLRTRVADASFPEVGSVSISVGAARLQPDDDVDSLLERADAALYEAKRSGRNAVRA